MAIKSAVKNYNYRRGIFGEIPVPWSDGAFRVHVIALAEH